MAGRQKRGSKPREKSPSSATVPATGLNEGRVTIRTDTGAAFSLDFSDGDSRKLLQRSAMQWAYSVRNRDRWLMSGASQARLHEAAAKTMQDFGLAPDAAPTLGRARLIEIGIPFIDEESGWEARVFPWEYVLSGAVRHAGARWRALVVRHLERSTAVPERSPVSRVLVVTSSPGRLEQRYTFESEQDLVLTNCQLTDPEDESRVRKIHNPSLGELRSCIESFSPDLIHLTGLDAHQGAALLNLGEDSSRRDGFYLATDNGEETVVDSQTLGRVLNCGREHTPAMVFINTHNSASRLAALAVAEGAAAALGFQDVIDDQLAESFLANFYRAWTLADHNPWHAANHAWTRLRRQPRTLRGSGVILWSEEAFSGHSFVDKVVDKQLDEERNTRYHFAGDEDRRDKIHVSYTPPARINYSTLHNDEDLFRSFRLGKSVNALIEDVDVTVSLQVGSESFAYRSRVAIDQNPTFLEGQIRVPLTWEYVRHLKESVRSTLFVEVEHESCVLVRATHSVNLQPVQEWSDTDEDRAWLPSFILPRDPQVAAVVRHAERYLCALTDSFSAGFDGYQSLDGDLDFTEAVDLQARAIWAALVFDHDLNYVNPPPSYAYGSQRLRTPSEIFSAGHGTCIDLALLFAACLEYVDIYPAIFLLRGHAFPAYWRSLNAYDDFGAMRNVIGDSHIDAVSEGRFDSVQRFKNWMITGEASHQDILASVQRGHLVPLESVAMTARLGFEEAIEQGLDNVHALEEFESLIDVPLARRRYGVTPLPFQAEEMPS
ncbi:MAG: hypothetical protein AAF671_06365 [Pseudomonadota bacterium]